MLVRKDKESFHESLIDLIKQATDMLQDRHRCEADLIYYIAKLDNETRTAIVLAYQMLYEGKVE